LTREVLQLLQEHNLAIESNKWEWYQKQVEFLACIRSGEVFSISEDKNDIIVKSEIPESVKDIQ
jgi:hypothetical protein